jgi:hypothetical protein
LILINLKQTKEVIIEEVMSKRKKLENKLLKLNALLEIKQLGERKNAN